MKSFTVIDCEQRTSEWFQARIGRVTSSHAHKVTARGRKPSDESTQRRDLRIRLALERIAGKSFEDSDFSNRHMDRGVEREPDAYGYYEALSGRLLERTGFCRHNDLMAGCSLDGSFDDFTGIVEIKSPGWNAHLEYLESGTVPTDYMKQIVHAMFVTGAEWCDWLSYNPDFPEPLRVKLVRVERDPAVIESYATALSLFLAEVDLKEETLRTMSDLRRQLERSLA